MTEAKKAVIERYLAAYKLYPHKIGMTSPRWVNDIKRALDGKSIVFSDHPDWVYEVYLVIKKERECSTPTP